MKWIVDNERKSIIFNLRKKKNKEISNGGIEDLIKQMKLLRFSGFKDD